MIEVWNEIESRIAKDFIVARKLPVGGKLPTVKKLAAHYSKSCPTILNAIKCLSNKGIVSRRQGSGIFVKNLDFLTQRESLLPRIGYVSCSFKYRLSYLIMEGISYQASKMGFGLEVESSNGSTEKERQIIERMFNSGVQGVILYPYLRLSESEEYLNKEFTHPIVIVDLYQPSMRRPSVVFDNFSAGCDITNYLIGQGKRRIAFLRFPQSFYISIDERCRGYLRALENFGISYNPDHVIEFIDEHWPFKTSVVNLNKAILQLVQGTCVPDAIILPSETYIAEVRDILSSVGITQDQISIVGFDNILSRDAEDNYVSTSPNFPYMGERACQLLAEIIATKKSDCSCLTLPCPIVYGKQAIGKRAIDDLYLHAHGIKANYGNLSRDLD